MSVAYELPLWQCEHVGPHGDRCTGEQLSTSDFCILHAPIGDLDLSAFKARQLRAANYKLADALPTAAETMVQVVKNSDEIASVRLKAAAEILDRAGIPRAAATQVTTDLTVRVEKTAGQVLAERLAALATRVPEALTYTTVDATPDTDDDDGYPEPTPVETA